MELNQLDLNQIKTEQPNNTQSVEKSLDSEFVSLEAEIPEVLFTSMKDFLGNNPQWDQYRLMSSALANFLFQNGCEDRAVAERYLNDLFNRHLA